MSYSTTILADSPVGYWRLGESSGISAVDLGSGGNNGVYTPNSSGAWIGGTLGVSAEVSGDTAAEFNGTDGYVAVSGNEIGGLTQMTMEAWFYRSSTGHIVTAGYSPATNVRAQFVWYSDGNVYWQIENGLASYPYCALAGTGWHHLVMVYDGSLSGLARLTVYIDGVAQTLTGGGNDPASSLPSTGDLGNLRIGSDQSQSRYTTGRIDEFAIYAAALNSTQVAAHYAARLASGTLPPLSMAYHLAGIR